MKTVQLLLVVILTTLIFVDGQINAQSNEPQREPSLRVELLTLAGGKPELGSDGDGITSFRTTDLFKIGQTHVKPFDWSFKVELPTGYTLYNKLAYVIDSDAVFSGPNDFAVKLPAATTKDVFENLHILYAAPDDAEPDKPRWIDATVEGTFGEYWERYLSKPEFEKRQADFTTRTIHAVTEDNARILVIAQMDPSKVRAHFVADIAVSATPSQPSVMEGRPIDYIFKVTNNGPDTATSVSFRSFVTPDLISIEQTQGVCRWDAHNIYCNLGDIPNGKAATITFHGRCVWDFYIGDKPGQSGGMDVEPFVSAAEGDANGENNMIRATASVLKDRNEPPIVEIASPTEDQFFVGPEPDIRVTVKAHDPDGTISEVQLYSEKGLMGNPTLVAENTYEFTLPKASYGQHFLQALAKDNFGRPSQTQVTSFHVNGQAKIEVLSPTPNQVIIGPLEQLVVKVRVTDPAREISKVTVHKGLQFGGIQEPAHPTDQKGEFSATFKAGPGRLSLYVDVVDDAGIQTLSYPFQFKITAPPSVKLSYVDGEYAKDLEDGGVLPAGRNKLVVYVNDGYDSDHPGVTELDLFANEQTICHVSDKTRKQSTGVGWDIIECPCSLKPGRYTLAATVKDSEGAIGKSKPVAVVVQ